MEASALTTHNGYCKSPTPHAVKLYLVSFSSSLETLIMAPVLDCVCAIGADAGFGAFL